MSIRRLYRRLLASALRDPIDLGALAIDGDDLRRAGIPPGPRLGSILNALLGSVLEDPARNTPEWLLDEARRVYAGDGGNA
jgi:tRNA nucleotidyltransferase (CCA-adding enzyme)